MRRRTLLHGAAAVGASAVLARGEPDRRGGPVRVGLEVLSGEASVWRGRRVALLAHDASRTSDGRPAWEVIEALGARVVRLFSPEHGLGSSAEAGARVADDEMDGRPVVSLYGARRVPDPVHLSDVDVVVADLQDAGVRFYTYAATLLDVLDAAERAGREVVVLDRPNPLGGELVDGPLAASGAEATIFNRTPGPLVHGLTMGEIAGWHAAGRPRLRLRVVPLSGWDRGMRWTDTGLPWRPPSPNLRSPEAAIAYPGTALLEGTNVSEGRGTDAPFLRIGAPWIDRDLSGLVGPVPGFTLSDVRFVPRPTPAARSPKHEGVACRGLRVRVSDPARARGYALGVHLLVALRGRPGFAWLDAGRAIDRLVATPALRQAVEAGLGAEEIVRRDAVAHEQWRERRQGWLRYR